MSLDGLSVSISQLNVAQKDVQQTFEHYSVKLNFTKEIYTSSQKFTQHIKQDPGVLEPLLNLWPKTKTGLFTKNKEILSAWLTKNTKNAKFQNPLLRFSDFFALSTAHALLQFCNTIQKHIIKDGENSKIAPVWHLINGV